ncbi:7-cyano-7-deazaguanine synthase [Pontibacter fetidus]|uniref:7-cyano-7-deazaguanine synthase n=1 Tax=Pontibacter fetidus TaxID=2700082 RepID=A0A6B2H9G4_9BACT|nr:7-cyano-7-deazaguanine synthase [Pontibacter fetidus]NDK57367.1 7-cyano-7-deazaguanine synthase [Pontibacter fetidus]
MSKAILLSGGLDSIALAYWKKPDIAFTINYGQKPALAEIKASAAVCTSLRIEHNVITVDCSALGSGDLVGENAISLAPASEWWPYRNQLLVTLACMRGVGLGVTELMVGTVKTDAFHADGTEGFYERMNQLVSYQEGGVRISSPGICYSTTELIQMSQVPASILLWGHSCHTSNIPCGNCRGCHKYLYVKQQLGYD